MYLIWRLYRLKDSYIRYVPDMTKGIKSEDSNRRQGQTDDGQTPIVSSQASLQDNNRRN